MTDFLVDMGALAAVFLLGLALYGLRVHIRSLNSKE